MIGIIGGTGVYEIEGLEVTAEKSVETPFGKPSSPLLFTNYNGKELVFLARHGKNHEFLPHEVNYRANIWALKSVGVMQVVGVSAVGSLRLEIKPGDFVIASQYFDFVKGDREKTFFGGGLAAHVSTAEPTCPDLTASLQKCADNLQMKLHTEATYGCVDGPRLGTKAESHFLKNSAGCDLVGMTNVPEVFLAREAQLCYCTIGVVTDYDCWLDNPDEHVTVADVISRYGESIAKVKVLIKEFLSAPTPQINQQYRRSLQYAILTPELSMTKEQKQLLSVLSK